MKLFIDTPNIKEIKEIEQWGVLAGVTTNPSLVLRESNEFEHIIKEITELVKGTVSAEVVSVDAEGMIKEGRELANINSNVVIRVPMTKEGLKAVKIFREEGVKTSFNRFRYKELLRRLGR